MGTSPSHFLFSVVPDSCTPLNDTTFLLAYSNDFDSSVINQLVDFYASDTYLFTSHFTTYASVRFDTKNGGELEYQTHFDDVAAYVRNHLPDPSLSFDSNDTGSDVLKIIDRFLENTEVPVCGSKMIIYVKRYPNETEYSQIVAKMRQHHSYLTIFASTDPSGGYHPETLYDLASKTNGICNFDPDADIRKASGNVETVYNPYLVYAVNSEVSGKGRVQLLPLLAPNATSYWVSLVLQDNGSMNVVQTAMLSWKNENSNGQLGKNGSSFNGEETGNYFGYWYDLNTVLYDVHLDYYYSDTKARRLQIRVHGDGSGSIDHWVPYDN